MKRFPGRKYPASRLMRYYDRDASAMKNVFAHKLKWNFLDYTSLNPISCARKDNPKIPQAAPTKKLIVNVNSSLVELNAEQLKWLVDLDTEHDRSYIVLINHNSSKNEHLLNYLRLARLFNNKLCRSVLAPTKIHPRDQLLQIYYNGYDGKEPKPPVKVIVPFTINGETYTFEIPSLDIFPKIKAMGISYRHKDFHKLVKTTITLPIIGEIPFQQFNEKNSIDNFIPLIPEHILAHNKIYPDVKPAKFGDFIHPETKNSSTSEEITKYVSSQLEIPVPSNTMTPYIVNKRFKEGIKKKIKKDGKELQVQAFEDDFGAIIPLNLPEVEEILPIDDTIAETYKKRFDGPESNVPYSKISFKYQIYPLMKDGLSLTSHSREHTNRFSMDILRGLLLRDSQYNGISDINITTEYSLLNSLGKILQLFEDQIKNEGIIYHENLSKFIEKNKQFIKPWDFYILDRFSHILNKGSFQNFLLMISKYKIAVECEVDKNEERRKVSNAIFSNIMMRLLYHHIKYFYPVLAGLYTEKVEEVNKLTSTSDEKILPGYHYTAINGLKEKRDDVIYNEFDHYIKYAKESFPSDDLQIFLKTIGIVSSIKPLEPFYNLRKLVITRDPFILQNKEILQNSINVIAKPLDFKISDDELLINGVDTSFIENNVVSQTIEVDYENTSIISFRQLPLGDDVPEYIKAKLKEINFSVADEIPLELLKRDLLIRLLSDISDKYYKNSQSFLRYELQSFAVRFVTKLPPSFFILPFHNKIKASEFKTPLDPELMGIPAILQRVEDFGHSREDHAREAIRLYNTWNNIEY